MSVRTATLALLVLVALSSACITRTHYDGVYDVERTTVRLRSESKAGSTIRRGFEHPVTIAPIRIAHILSSIDVREPEGEERSERKGAIPLASLYSIADGVAAALEKANPDQEVVVQSIEKRKKTGIFDHFYLTSFVAYVKDGQLLIHLSHLDYEVDLHSNKPLPTPRSDRQVMKFRVLPSASITPVGPQVVAVNWRDPVFRQPSRIRTMPGGRVVRREILMESPLEDAPLPGDALPANLAPATLRDLADLEEERRSGAITEAEYNARRREILESDPGAAR